MLYILALFLSVVLCCALPLFREKNIMTDLVENPFDTMEDIEPISQYFYVKRFKLISHDSLGFLQGRWLESREYNRDELIEEFGFDNEFLDSISSKVFEAATHDEQWIKIMPLKHMRVLK